MPNSEEPSEAQSAPPRRRRLSEFMRRRHSELLALSQASLPALPEAGKLAIPKILDRIGEVADAIECGEDLRTLVIGDRLDSDFSLREVVADYAVARDCILTLWEHDGLPEIDFADLRMLNRAIDAAVATAIDRYMLVRDRALQAFDRIAIVSLESSCLDELLTRLLEVLTETLHIVDTASIHVRDGDRLQVRAAVGTAPDEHFARRVIAAGEPLLTRNPDPRLRVLYGVPLIEAGETIGSAQMGSYSVDELTSEETNLLAMMGTRATAAIYQHLLLETAEWRAAELAAVIESMPAAVYIGDHGGISRANRAAFELMPPAEVAVDEPFRRALGGETVKRDVRVRHAKTQQELVMQSLAAPIRRGDDVIGAVVVKVDITERNRLENTLRQRERDQRFVTDVVNALSTSFRYPQTLEELARMLVAERADWCVVDVVERDGTKRVAVAHKDPAKLEFARDWARRYPPDWSGARGIGQIGQVIRTGQPVFAAEIADEQLVMNAADEGELELMRLLGPKSFIAVPLVARGHTLGAISVLSAEAGRLYGQADVDLLRRIGHCAGVAIDNAHAYVVAQEAVRMREEILAVVSHDLKNPLSAIHMAAAALEQSDEPRVRKHAEAIDRNAERMDRMIKDLLDMASVQAGHLSLEKKAEDAAGLCRELFEQYGALAREKGIELVVDCSLEGVKVHCDRARILQVFGNLLDNAIKFCAAGDEIDVIGRRVSNGVHFVVEDTGPGIPPADIEHVFEPYWSAKRHAKMGTGLGLYISRGIIEAHGGRLTAESKPDNGARFQFTLPYG